MLKPTLHLLDGIFQDMNHLAIGGNPHGYGTPHMLKPTLEPAANAQATSRNSSTCEAPKKPRSSRCPPPGGRATGHRDDPQWICELRNRNATVVAWNTTWKCWTNMNQLHL